MDPNLFAVDWDRLFEALSMVIVLAFIIERALSLLFEHRWFLAVYGKTSGIKEPIAFLVSWFVCWYWQFDVLSVLILRDKVSPFGIVITAALVAGGSKGSLKLFRDVLHVEDEVAKRLREKKNQTAARELGA